MAPDQTVELAPGGKTARVRSVQVHGAKIDRAIAGQRVAMNLVGLDKDEISRGQVVAAPSSLPTTRLVDAYFTFCRPPGR